MGKGAALKAGFKMALEMGFDHAITLDSDSQHRASDIPAFLEALEKEVDPCWLMGSRVLDRKMCLWGIDLPTVSPVSGSGLKPASGLRIPRSGFRLYPIRDMEGIRLISGKYEFELEILVKAAWKGIP